MEEIKMALIFCPECGKEISDKVNACPHCGYPMTEGAEQPEPAQPIESSPIEALSKNINSPKKVIVRVAVALCVALVAIIGIFIAKSNADKQAALEARNDYIYRLMSIRDTMLEGGAEAETVCNLTKNVWYNTVYEKEDSETDKYTRDGSGTFNDDFNDSLRALYENDDIKSNIASIKVNRDVVDQMLKNLQNPGEEFMACYNTLDLLYDEYCGLTNLAISLSGSYTTYSDSFRDYDADFMKYYEKLGTLIPEIQR